jgi:hypothetical protein
VSKVKNAFSGVPIWISTDAFTGFEMVQPVMMMVLSVVPARNTASASAGLQKRRVQVGTVSQM